jgi:hypothetical protein
VSNQPGAAQGFRYNRDPYPYEAPRQLNADSHATAARAPQHRAFTSFSNRDFRIYLFSAFNSMAQALVQMNAPGALRGRVIGVFSMSAMGMRTFSGLSVGLLGASVGIHNSLALSATGLFVLIAVMLTARHVRRSW